MSVVQLSKEAQAVLARNLAKDKKFVNAQRKAERQRDEALPAHFCANCASHFNNPNIDENGREICPIRGCGAFYPSAEQPDLTLQVAAACIDRFPVKIGRTWVR